MRAITHQAFGAPHDVLRLSDVEIPAIGSDEVLVAVRATAVASGDWLVTRGLPHIARPSYGLRSPKHHVAGLEYSGVVKAVGDAVLSSRSVRKSSDGATARSPSTWQRARHASSPSRPKCLSRRPQLSPSRA